MSIRRKLFLAMAGFIAGMGLAFVLITQFVVKDIVVVMAEPDRKPVIDEIAGTLADYYQRNDASWEGIENIELDPDIRKYFRDVSVLLVSSSDKQTIFKSGNVHEEMIIRLGIARPVRVNGEETAVLYYYDREVGNLAKMRLGIGSSVTFLLLRMISGRTETQTYRTAKKRETGCLPLWKHSRKKPAFEPSLIIWICMPSNSWRWQED